MMGLKSLTRKRLHQEYPEEVDRESARTLGIVSLAIGMTEIVAARHLDRFMGTGNGQNAGIFRILGVREIGHGIDLLSHPDDPAPGLWGRVAGDVLDNAMLGLAATRTKKPGGLAAIVALVLPVVVADMLLAPRMSKKKHDAEHAWF